MLFLNAIIPLKKRFDLKCLCKLRGVSVSCACLLLPRWVTWPFLILQNKSDVTMLQMYVLVFMAFELLLGTSELESNNLEKVGSTQVIRPWRNLGGFCDTWKRPIERSAEWGENFKKYTQKQPPIFFQTGNIFILLADYKCMKNLQTTKGYRTAVPSRTFCNDGDILLGAAHPEPLTTCGCWAREIWPVRLQNGIFNLLLSNLNLDRHLCLVATVWDTQSDSQFGVDTSCLSPCTCCSLCLRPAHFFSLSPACLFPSRLLCFFVTQPACPCLPAYRLPSLPALLVVLLSVCSIHTNPLCSVARFSTL